VPCPAGSICIVIVLVHFAAEQGCLCFMESSERLHDQEISLGSESLIPPLWSSGQSSWLQIRRPGFDSRYYQKKN
jgi:hypothetical protein